jgi:DNA-binding CsgD family transcriptional regulator
MPATVRIGLVGTRQARARLRDLLVGAGHTVAAEGATIDEASAAAVDVVVVVAPDGPGPAGLPGDVPVVFIGPLVAATHGPAGFLAAAASAEQVLAAVLAVAAGLTVVDPALGPGAVPTPGEDEPVEALTAREREVLSLLAAGLPNKAIARELGISENTAKYHVAAILAKLDAQSRADAVMRAARAGLLPL